MSNSIIRSYFETRVKAWADAQTPVVPVAFQNVPFTRPTLGSATNVWLECFVIPNVTTNVEISGKRSTKYGLVQINCWGQQGKGMKAVEAVADALVNLFPIVPKGVVSVEGTPDVKPSIPDGAGWVAVPVTIKYRYEDITS